MSKHGQGWVTESGSIYCIQSSVSTCTHIHTNSISQRANWILKFKITWWLLPIGESCFKSIYWYRYLLKSDLVYLQYVYLCSELAPSQPDIKSNLVLFQCQGVDSDSQLISGWLKSPVITMLCSKGCLPSHLLCALYSWHAGTEPFSPSSRNWCPSFTVGRRQRHLLSSSKANT